MSRSRNLSVLSSTFTFTLPLPARTSFKRINWASETQYERLSPREIIKSNCTIVRATEMEFLIRNIRLLLSAKKDHRANYSGIHRTKKLMPQDRGDRHTL